MSAVERWVASLPVEKRATGRVLARGVVLQLSSVAGDPGDDFEIEPDEMVAFAEALLADAKGIREEMAA